MSGADWPRIAAWHAAVNARDAEAAARLAAPDVRLGGPKGSAAGLDVLRAWVAEAGIRLVPLAWHPVPPGAVVVEERATWPHRADAEPDAAPVLVFTAYRLRDGRIAAVLRFDSLDQALAAAREGGG